MVWKMAVILSRSQWVKSSLQAFILLCMFEVRDKTFHGPYGVLVIAFILVPNALMLLCISKSSPISFLLIRLFDANDKNTRFKGMETPVVTRPRMQHKNGHVVS